MHSVRESRLLEDRRQQIEVQAASAADALVAGDHAGAAHRLEQLGFADSGAMRHLLHLGSEVPEAERPGWFSLAIAALAASPDPDLALVHLLRYEESARADGGETVAGMAPDWLERLALLSGFSPFLSSLLIRFPHWAGWLRTEAGIEHARSPADVEAVLAGVLQETDDPRARRLALLRASRRELLRLGARRIFDLSDESTMAAELSDLAAATLRIALAEVMRGLVDRFGRPYEEASDGTLARRHTARFAVIAMGKLGGRELNFSSDIDLMFVYSEEGWTSGRDDGTGRITNHQFFTRVGEELVRYLTEATEEGFFYRVDTRLRPDGETGPLARSLTAYEIYYTTQAHPWERPALLKARWIAGDARLGATFEEMVRPLVFNPLHGDLLIEHIQDLKQRIDHEVTRRLTADREVKRGTGGIREIEFLVQTLQMLHGAHHPDLAVSGSLEAIDALERHGLLPADQARHMRDDYLFLRTLEHRLQMMQLRQTHLLPTEPRILDALARRCGIEAESGRSAGERLMDRWHETSRRVHADFVAFFGSDEDVVPIADGGDPVRVATRAVLSDLPESQALPLLEPLGLASSPILKALRRMAGQGRTHYLTTSGRETFERLLPAMLQDLADTPRPEAALTSLESLIGASGASAGYFELFLQSPETRSLLLHAFGSSGDVAQTFIAHPEFIDYLSDPAALHGAADREAMRARLDQWLVRTRDDHARLAAMARFKRLEYLLTVLGEIGMLLDYAEATDRMTATAELLVEQARRDSAAAMGLPPDGEGFAVLSMGKFGAGELNFYSDLDLIFVWDERFNAGGRPQAEAAEELANGLIVRLTTATNEGRIYEVDARLRPEGQSAPLAPPVERYIEYYGRRAEPWEFQSAMQLRPVAGDRELGHRLRHAIGAVIARRASEFELAGEIRSMRRRMEASVRLPRWVFCDFKRGPGGTVDLEFTAQYLQLLHLHDDAELIGLGPRLAFERLEGHGLIDAALAAELEQRYLWLRMLERRTRRLLGSDRSAIPGSGDKLEALERVCRPLLEPGESLLDRVARELRRNRALFEQVLGP